MDNLHRRATEYVTGNPTGRHWCWRGWNERQWKEFPAENFEQALEWMQKTTSPGHGELLLELVETDEKGISSHYTSTVDWENPPVGKEAPHEVTAILAYATKKRHVPHWITDQFYRAVKLIGTSVLDGIKAELAEIRILLEKIQEKLDLR